MQPCNECRYFADPSRRLEEGVLHRRGRNTRALRRALRNRQRRLLVDRGPVGLRQVDAAVDSRLARHAERRPLRAERPPVENLNASQRAQIRNKEIGFIFQAFNLIGDLTVFENVELPLTYRAGMKAAERKKRVLEALERVRMAHRLNHYPAQLSGGQQQRVAVARALVGSPSILLADEPTGNLDSKNGEQVMALLAELHADGATICIVTHDPRYADYADRKIHMFDGRVVDEETMNRLREEEDRRIAEQARRGRPKATEPEEA